MSSRRTVALGSVPGATEFRVRGAAAKQSALFAACVRRVSRDRPFHAVAGPEGIAARARSNSFARGAASWESRPRRSPCIWRPSTCPTPRTAERQAQLRHWTAEAMAIVSGRAHWEIVRLSREPEFRADCRWIAATGGRQRGRSQSGAHAVAAPGSDRWPMESARRHRTVGRGRVPQTGAGQGTGEGRGRSRQSSAIRKDKK